MPTDPTIPPPQPAPAPVPLTEQDEHLLSAIFDPDSDLLVAAAHVGMTEVQLIDWSTQPHIQQRITAQRALRRLRKEIRSDATARRTIDALEDIAHTADDPIERRRAAAAILRFLNPLTPRRSRARSASEEPAPHPRDSNSPSGAGVSPATPPVCHGSASRANPPESSNTPEPFHAPVNHDDISPKRQRRATQAPPHNTPPHIPTSCHTLPAQTTTTKPRQPGRAIPTLNPTLATSPQPP